jgi:hypothetical protein
VGIFLYLLTPSSPSSWCGRRGRLFVDVRDSAVDDPGSAVGGRSRDGALTVDQSWTAGLPAIGDPRMTSSPPPLAGAFGADQPHLSTSDPGCPPNPALFPHGWRQKRGECPWRSFPLAPDRTASEDPNWSFARLQIVRRGSTLPRPAAVCGQRPKRCHALTTRSPDGVPVTRAPVAIVWQKSLPRPAVT